MYVDKGLMFSDGQNVASGVSQNVIDFGKKGDGYTGSYLVVSLEQALTASQSLVIEVQTSAEGGFASPVSLASFTARKGTQAALRQKLPVGLDRYVRLNYTVAGAPAGKLSAIVAADVETR